MFCPSCLCAQKCTNSFTFTPVYVYVKRVLHVYEQCVIPFVLFYEHVRRKCKMYAVCS